MDDQVHRVGTTRHAPRALAASAAGVFVLDGPDVVTLEPDGRARVLVTLGGPHASLAAAADALLVADMNGSRVLHIALASGAVRALTEGEPRPLDPRIVAGRAYWTSNPYVPDPVRGAPLSVTETRVRVADLANGGARELARMLHAWDLCPMASGAVCLVARVEDHGRRLSVLRRVGLDGAVEDACALADTEVHGFVRMTAGPRDVAWSGRVRAALWTCREEGSAARELAELPLPVIVFAGDAAGVVAIVGDAQDDARAVLYVPWQGPARTLARYRTQGFDRPEVAPVAGGVYWTAGRDVWFAPRVA